MEHVISLIGLFVMMGIALLFCEDRKNLDYRSIGMGIALQFTLGLLVLWTAPGRMLLEGADDFVLRVVQFSNDGAQMVFGEKFRDHFFAFAVLPSIIFFSSLMAVLFHLGVMQRVISAFSWVMHKTMRVSGAEAMAASAKIFVGGVESAFTIKPYVPSMTRSEIMALSTTGLATIACGVLAVYVSLGMSAGYLLAAQIMSTTASLVVAKIMIPETDIPKTRGAVKIGVEKTAVNVFDAACRGALDGLQVAACVAAVLIAFVALTSMLNYALGLLPLMGGGAISVERVLGWCFRPIVFLTGAPWADCGALGTLLGKKVFLNEFLAFLDLKAIKDQLAPRSVMLATFFLCGFANFSAVAMQIGGMSSLFPERRKDFAELGLKSMIGGTLAGLMSACMAGVIL